MTVIIYTGFISLCPHLEKQRRELIRDDIPKVGEISSIISINVSSSHSFAENFQQRIREKIHMPLICISEHWFSLLKIYPFFNVAYWNPLLVFITIYFSFQIHWYLLYILRCSFVIHLVSGFLQILEWYCSVAVIYLVGPLEEIQKHSVISLAYTPSSLKPFFSKILKIDGWNCSCQT